MHGYDGKYFTEKLIISLHHLYRMTKRLVAPYIQGKLTGRAEIFDSFLFNKLTGKFQT